MPREVGSPGLHNSLELGETKEPHPGASAGRSSASLCPAALPVGSLRSLGAAQACSHHSALPLMRTVQTASLHLRANDWLQLSSNPLCFWKSSYGAFWHTSGYVDGEEKKVSCHLFYKRWWRTALCSSGAESRTRERGRKGPYCFSREGTSGSWIIYPGHRLFCDQPRTWILEVPHANMVLFSLHTTNTTHSFLSIYLITILFRGCYHKFVPFAFFSETWLISFSFFREQTICFVFVEWFHFIPNVFLLFIYISFSFCPHFFVFWGGVPLDKSTKCLSSL